MSGWTGRAGAAALALVLDRALGEPPARWHPVARFGASIGAVERRCWTDARWPGVGYAGAGIALGAVAGAVVGAIAPVVWLCVAGRELRRVAGGVEERLRADDLAGARALLPSLVGRDPHALDGPGIAAAVIESLAENSVDAVLAPLCWALLVGAPGASAYRAVNTMDAMVGHHSPRYERFGWAAARADDVAGYLPARLFALLVAVACPGRVGQVWAAVRRDAPAHPSPNAGVAEAAVAGALGIELGGPLSYGSRVENRPRLGSGPRPVADDIAAAIRLTARVENSMLLALSALGAVHHAARRRSGRNGGRCRG